MFKLCESAILQYLNSEQFLNHCARLAFSYVKLFCESAILLNLFATNRCEVIKFLYMLCNTGYVVGGGQLRL